MQWRPEVSSCLIEETGKTAASKKVGLPLPEIKIPSVASVPNEASDDESISKNHFRFIGEVGGVRHLIGEACVCQQCK